MAVTLEQVKRMLGELGVATPIALGPHLVFQLEGISPPVLVSAAVDGDVLQFRTVKLLMAPAPAYRKTLQAALLDTCYHYKMLKVTLDASDGEVVGYIDLFLADATLTRKQLQRCLSALGLLRAIRTRCEAIVETGTDPGDQAPMAILEEAMRRAGQAGTPPRKSSSGKATPKLGTSGKAGPKLGTGFDSLLDNLLKDQPGKSEDKN
jgi:hypothetical protein